MTWKETLIARILLLVARMVADDPALATEIKHLANHVQATSPKQEPGITISPGDAATIAAVIQREQTRQKSLA